MRFLSLVVAVAMVGNALADLPSIDAPSESSKLKSISNRINLFGWEGDPRVWTVKDGSIRGETTPENPIKGNTFLIWKEGLTRDFELRLSFRSSSTNSSGIQYRSKKASDPTAKTPWTVRGYQYEIRNENILPNVPGFLYDEGGKRGRMCMVGESASMEMNGKKIVKSTLMDAATFKKLMKLDSWNDVVIIAVGNHIKHYLNNKLILEFTDNNSNLASSVGLLALQLTAGKPMWVEFKNVRIRDVTEQELIDEEAEAIKAQSDPEVKP